MSRQDLLQGVTTEKSDTAFADLLLKGLEASSLTVAEMCERVNKLAIARSIRSADQDALFPPVIWFNWGSGNRIPKDNHENTQRIALVSEVLGLQADVVLGIVQGQRELRVRMKKITAPNEAAGIDTVREEKGRTLGKNPAKPVNKDKTKKGGRESRGKSPLGLAIIRSGMRAPEAAARTYAYIGKDPTPAQLSNLDHKIRAAQVEGNPLEIDAELQMPLEKVLGLEEGSLSENENVVTDKDTATADGGVIVVKEIVRPSDLGELSLKEAAPETAEFHLSGLGQETSLNIDFDSIAKKFYLVEMQPILGLPPIPLNPDMIDDDKISILLNKALARGSPSTADTTATTSDATHERGIPRETAKVTTVETQAVALQKAPETADFHLTGLGKETTLNISFDDREKMFYLGEVRPVLGLPRIPLNPDKINNKRVLVRKVLER